VMRRITWFKHVFADLAAGYLVGVASFKVG